MKFYQAFVEVHGADGYRYWNRLAMPTTSRAEAEQDIASYLQHKHEGTGGFRVGPPGRTRIDEKDIGEPRA